MIHRFKQDIGGILPPTKFTFPFDYIPHSLCVFAAKQIQEMLCANEWLNIEAQKGKMFGVLVVENDRGEIGFLMGFSGLLGGMNVIDGFVPPVYDLLDETGFFKEGERELSEMTNRVEAIRNDAEYMSISESILRKEQEFVKWKELVKAEMKKSKNARDKFRKENEGNVSVIEKLTKESQFEKAEYNREKKKTENDIQLLKEKALVFENALVELKNRRKKKSIDLQKRLFACYKLKDGRGEEKTILDIFTDYNGQLPPAGTGECAAPKMLQYAYKNGLKPLCMAEFWIGKSLKGEVRKEGNYYASCQSKCYPLLTYMLQGVEVEEDPKLNSSCGIEPKIVWEDEWLIVVDKPSGMLSVPGKISVRNVYDWAKNKWCDIEDPVIVHRLDMATSGLMILAKKKLVYEKLQKMFVERKIAKKYMALLEGVLESEEGEISLPLRVDVEDRPRQMVDFECGKRAVSKYRVIEVKNGRTLVELQPLTGRTHQLRVHCASELGLKCPIVGDALYGKHGERLCLHAAYLKFKHPSTDEIIELKNQEYELHN